MSIKYRNVSGQEVVVSGLTPGGDIEAGAVATRSGSGSISSTAGAWGQTTVTFTDPMPDADYIVNIEVTGQTSGAIETPVTVSSKTKNGFVASVYGGSTVVTIQFKYTAWKIYSVQHAAQNAEDIANIKTVIPSTASSTNQLAPKKYVDDADTALDGRVSDLEDLIPNNASVTNQLATKAEINNVYTKTEVDTKLDDKQDTLTFDNEPTAGSSNPVKSNGIYTITNGLQDHANKNGAKNFLESKGGEAYSGNAHFVTNPDGSITVNGTASAYLPFYMGKSYLEAGTYTVSMNEIQVGFGIRNIANSNWMILISPTHGFSKQLTITDEEAGFHQMVLFLESYAPGGTDIVAYPMIRLVSDPDDTFEPYAKTNLVLTKESFESKANALTGSKNILRNSATSRTNVYGIDWTVYDDGSVKANGSNTGTQSNFSILSNKTFPIGKYILNGCTGGTMSTYHLYVHNVTKSTVVAISFDGDAHFEVTDPADLYTVVCCVKPNASVTDVMFYPMIRAEGDGNDTFVPYAMTNRELTEKVNIELTKSDESSSLNLNTSFLCGKIVEFNFNISNTILTANSWKTIATFPVQYAPTALLQFPCIIDDNNGNNMALALLRVTAGGKIEVRPNSATQTCVRVGITYVR